MNVIFILAIVLFVFWRMWLHLNPKTTEGSLSVGGNDYRYTIGDSLVNAWALLEGKYSSFNGIDISLPKALPHIYLDSHHDDKIAGPRFYIPIAHKVSLEGDFDKHFQLYAADGYKQQALSIISPDVMQTLITSAGRYDVEIRGNNLRLISQKPLFRNAAAQQEIIAAAEIVLGEVAHRLRSWSDVDTNKAHLSALPVDYEQTVKVGRRAVKSTWVRTSIASFLMTSIWIVGVYGASADATVQTVRPNTWDFYLGLIFCAAFPFMFVKLRVASRSNPLGSILTSIKRPPKQ